MINIRLEEDGAFVEIKKNKVSTWKKVSVEDIVAALTKSIGKRVSATPEPSPVLPPGTIGYIKYPDNPKHYTVVMHQNAIRGSIEYCDRPYDNIGIPASIWKFEVIENRLYRTDVWAITQETKIMRPEVPLYCFPFYNVDSTGKLCMGANNVKIEAPWELFKAPGTIMAMPSTRHIPLEIMQA